VSTNDLILGYLEVWNERDPAVRGALMKSVLTGDSVYSDPDYAALRGHDELSAAIDRAQQSFGDLLFTVDTVIGVHHHRALFTWRLGAVATGYDVVEFDGDLIRSVVGFFG
jgi:hypothetical protein